MLLRDTDVAQLTGLARNTLAKLRVSGGGPRFVKLNRAVRYPSEEVEQWIAQRGLRRSTSDIGTQPSVAA